LRSARPPEPSLVITKDEELSLSGDALIGLMQAVLARDAPFRFRAKGWSMSPFIRDGDVITIVPLNNALPRLGDVVAFIHPKMNKLVVHRVIGTRNGACIVQGDNVPGLVDGVIAQTSILGRVTRVQRNGRHIWPGLGPERYLIAFLSRAGLLVPLRVRLAGLARPFLHRRS